MQKFKNQPNSATMIRNLWFSELILLNDLCKRWSISNTDLNRIYKSDQIDCDFCGSSKIFLKIMTLKWIILKNGQWDIAALII